MTYLQHMCASFYIIFKYQGNNHIKLNKSLRSKFNQGVKKLAEKDEDK